MGACSKMMSAVFVPARSLPPCGFSPTRPPGFLPPRRLAVRAAKRSYLNAEQDVRPSVPSILRILNASQVSVVQILESLSPSMKLTDWLSLLEGLANQSKWALTLEVFRWMQRQKWYNHDDGFYAKLIVISGKARDLRMAVWLFNEVKRSGSRPDSSLYNALITAYLHSRDKGRGFEAAMKLFEKMKQKPKCQPNLVTYNILLRASAQLGDVVQVDRFFKEMEAAKIYPDLVTYNGVIGAYAEAGDYVQMEMTLFVMRIQKHIKPDNVTSNTLIGAYGRGKDFVKMEQVLKSMTGSKSKHRPDLKTYNLLMSSYARAQDMENMLWSFSRMEEASFKPNFRSFEILMYGFGGVGDFEKMRECFHQMLEASIKPQTSTLNTMISAYCKHNFFEEAEELLKEALEWQIHPRTSSYLIILRAYARDNRLNDMERLIERMRIADVAPVSASFLKSLEHFGLANWSEVQLTESTVEGLAEEDDVDVDLFEGSKNSSVSSSQVPYFSDDTDD